MDRKEFVKLKPELVRQELIPPGMPGMDSSGAPAPASPASPASPACTPTHARARARLSSERACASPRERFT